MRYSIRALLLIVALFGVLFAFLAYVTHDYRERWRIESVSTDDDTCPAASGVVPPSTPGHCNGEHPCATRARPIAIAMPE